MTSNPSREHFREAIQRCNLQSTDDKLLKSASDFFIRSHQLKYSYNFAWLGRPIIQYPQDIVAFQELVYEAKPELILETGIAHGGSLLLSASLLCMLDVLDGLDPRNSHRKVLGIDIDIRPHNLQALEEHPLRFKIDLIEGSSIDPSIIHNVRTQVQNYNSVFVCLDSNHTHDHVLSELNAYADLVTVGSYCIVFDTAVADLPADSFPDRPWGIGDNPKTAVHEWLKTHPQFCIDKNIDNKLMISVAPDGYIRRLSL
jgi:cephalosporin hydroxylase